MSDRRLLRHLIAFVPLKLALIGAFAWAVLHGVPAHLATAAAATVAPAGSLQGDRP